MRKKWVAVACSQRSPTRLILLVSTSVQFNTICYKIILQNVKQSQAVLNPCCCVRTEDCSQFMVTSMFGAFPVVDQQY